MVYSFLEATRRVLSEAFPPKTDIVLGAKAVSADNHPQIQIHTGKLKWGKTHLDVPTLTKDRLWVIRPFEQIAYIDLSATNFPELETKTALLTTVLMTNMDEIIKAGQKPDDTANQAPYQWVCIVKTVQWIHQKSSSEGCSYRLKINILGDFKAIKRTQTGTERIKKIHLVGD